MYTVVSTLFYIHTIRGQKRRYNTHYYRHSYSYSYSYTCSQCCMKCNRYRSLLLIAVAPINYYLCSLNEIIATFLLRKLQLQ